MFKLVIQDDEGKTTVVPLIRDEITIGRKEGNTIRLTERNVSRKHARIVRSNGTVAIEDLGSYNGVRVNGTRISARTPLTVSDRVQIGDYLIELKAEGAEQGAGTPASYEDAKTQPVERMDPGYGQRVTTPMQGAPPSPMAGGAPPPVPMAGGAPGQAPGPMMVGNPEQTLVALADTDPRMQARAAVVAATPPAGAVMPGMGTSGHARLVILSSNFAGREFELTKPQMVIGRTDDNDIVVNHRSISRNHAKVVREPETGRHTIMDLQSSNGVRVNGEEYGKVELRRGDIVDLGHVRLRFVEAGEDFVFGRDAHAVDVPTGGGKGVWIALAALLVIGGGVGIVLATQGGGGDKDGGEQATGPGTGAKDPAVAPAPADAAPAVATPDLIDAQAAAPGPDAKRLGELRGAVQSAIDNERWPEVASSCNEILELVPDDADCTQRIEQAKLEQGAQLTYDDFRRAVQQKEYRKVAQLYAAIDGTSMYKDKAREAHDNVRDAYVGTIRGRAASLAKQGKCKDIDTLIRTSSIWAEDAAAAREEASKCEAVAVAPDKGGGSKPDKGGGDKGGGDKGGGDKGGSSGGSSSSGKTVAQLVDEANAAARNGQYGKALRSAEEALKQDGGNQQALTTAAIAACNLKDAAKAKKFIGRLSGQRQGMARQICLRQNVTID